MNDALHGVAEPDSPPAGAPVLLVDSDSEFRVAFAGRMEKVGCQLECLSGVAELEEALLNTRPAALVISNDGPGIGAIDLVATLRAGDRWKQLPIFVVGERLGTETALRAYAAGADAALSKTRAAGLNELTARVLGAVRRSEDEIRHRAAPSSSVGAVAVPDVVVVEDDPALIEMLKYSLSNQGYELLFYDNGREALEGLLGMPTGARRPVVLLDVDLPGLDGFRVLQELSEERPGDFQVIMATMHSSEAAQVLAIESGALDYIVKPLSLPITLAKVERLLKAGGAR